MWRQKHLNIFSTDGFIVRVIAFLRPVNHSGFCQPLRVLPTCQGSVNQSGFCQPLRVLPTTQGPANHSGSCQPLRVLPTTQGSVNHSGFCQPLRVLPTTQGSVNHSGLSQHDGFRASLNKMNKWGQKGHPSPPIKHTLDTAHEKKKKIHRIHCKRSLLYRLVQCHRVSWLVGALSPVKPQRTTSGLRETFIKRYIAEGTNKAEMRLEKQSEKAQSCRENLWNEIQLKGP